MPGHQKGRSEGKKGIGNKKTNLLQREKNGRLLFGKREPETRNSRGNCRGRIWKSGERRVEAWANKGKLNMPRPEK